MSKSSLKPLESLVGEIKTLIEQSRRQVAVTVNAAMATLYWQIGRRINQEVLKEQRTEMSGLSDSWNIRSIPVSLNGFCLRNSKEAVCLQWRTKNERN